LNIKLTKLFDPIRVGEVETKNRIVFAPIVSNLATEEGFVSEKILRHYEEMAKGGSGLIIVEGSCIVPRAGYILTYDDKFIPGLTKLSCCMKKHGSKAFIQINHPGPKASSREEAVSASEVPIRDFRPRMLETDEVYNVIGKFAETGVRAMEAGFDGIDLQAGHFYLLGSFLSPYTNTRHDEFGGDTASRSMMVCAIIEGIKEEAGKDFSIICRINAVERLEGGMTIDESKKVSKHLVAAGADAIDVSAYDLPLSRTYAGMGLPVGSVGGKDDPEGSFVPYAAEIKGAVDVPVIAVSKLDNPVFANKVLEELKADLIAIGRGLLADPYMPKKAYEGRLDEINRCTYCNTCHTLQQRGKEIRCPVNPDLGL
jgi:2,4-dienoyl-CoA reductase-like NADH-dependent reductase (Old Yellow Enzyme family)